MDPVVRDILEAGLAEFAEHGLAGARVESVAARTRTSKRMIYYHFGGKEGLYAAVLDHAYRLVRGDGFDASRLEGVPAMQALESLVGHAFDSHCAHPEFVRLVMYENLQGARTVATLPGIAQLNRDGLAQVAALLERGQAEGSMRADVAVRDVARWPYALLLDAREFFRELGGAGHGARRDLLEVDMGDDLRAPVRRQRGEQDEAGEQGEEHQAHAATDLGGRLGAGLDAEAGGPGDAGEQEADDKQAVDGALAGGAGDRLGEADAGDPGAGEDQRARQLAEAQRQQEDHEEGHQAAAVQEVAREAGARVVGGGAHPRVEGVAQAQAAGEAVRQVQGDRGEQEVGAREVKAGRPQGDPARGEPQQEPGAEQRGEPQQELAAAARRGGRHGGGTLAGSGRGRQCACAGERGEVPRWMCSRKRPPRGRGGLWSRRGDQAAAAAAGAWRRTTWGSPSASVWTSATTLLPGRSLPARMSVASGSSRVCWIRRLSGRAPKAGS